ncbi:type II toxin-antitoxin system Phd/YefM family antitoxin [Syntrophothermus lipocalidus]|mgnify:FL=1|uniref:Antitoxin n=1 Tax=Syntrophothermus lipocalidus (strain DSM 12680 / TGB-C1) TaxID=643648 RepID=D7CMI4_SYNLT|nr:type II toxin-antitoxin system prevent-host-death family antitoxin [Syntrophothermus lipocalidus]ADI01919.1 prevent-host-death family protein [Syntrophothermus lipocalidus DSM 12680]HOV42651.1 type II toxin-antitoxin system prevent-host-death family antitoxin [Syntrophothermus lipocalidus]
MATTRIGIREAKMNLSRLIKEVQKGKDIIITDRGKEVARLTGIPKENLSLDARIQEMVKNGVLESEKRSLRSLPPPIPLEGDVAQRLLEEDRE